MQVSNTEYTYWDGPRGPQDVEGPGTTTKHVEFRPDPNHGQDDFELKDEDGPGEKDHKRIESSNQNSSDGGAAGDQSHQKD